MYAQVELATGGAADVLSLPRSAVIDSGARQLALVQVAEGRFEPRALKLGRRDGQFVEVLSGVAEGERVVTRANFLLDAESNLRAALGAPSQPVVVEPALLAADTPAPPPVAKVLTAKPDKTPPPKATPTVHHGVGKLEAIYSDGGVSITHQPIASLKWPGMTMDFDLTDPAVVSGIPEGSAIHFDLVERGHDHWVISKMSAVSSNPQPAEHHHAH